MTVSLFMSLSPSCCYYFLVLNVLLSTLFSKNLQFCSSLGRMDQTMYSYKGKDETLIM